MDKEFIKFIVIIVSVFTIMASLTIVAVSTLGEIGCAAKWVESGYIYRYRFITDCMVKDEDGTWIPASAVRVIK